VLHGKFKQLQEANLSLEINLLIEQEKNKQLQQKVQELTDKVQNLSKRKKKDEPILDGNSY
jgi:uncharacterized protein YlxW (UPF0749 family)